MLTLTFLRQSDPRSKSGRDCGALQDRRWSKRPNSGCPFPRAACLPRAEEWPGYSGSLRKRMKTSDRHSSRPPYFDFGGAGGKCWNILFTPLSRFLVFLSALSESVSLEELRQITFSVLASKRSTTKVPTL